uniref:NADH-ubiquinone oxidoreductase chain 4 n=1 Tax=Opimothrips tubulatus TaxID=2724111 RepID=A0A9E9ETS9_9NEOP|nr:NADH dehydrogenase subunit 4 [Opimothrips tubulatus]WAO28729.1 NADH dehydrogenase subunit 4 [Opimothrips tubulatus]
MLKMLTFILFLIHFIFLFNDWVLLVFGLCLCIFLVSMTNFNLDLMYINSMFLIDKFSIALVYLTLWIFVLSIISSVLIIWSEKNMLFMINIFSLMNVILMVFMVKKISTFFFMFESSLIFTLFLILGWGSKIERIKSGYYMFFYTLIGSLPLMVGIWKLKLLNFCMTFNMIEMFNVNGFFILFFFSGLMMKMPLFLFHSWLPKAHVEAPICGSMILAGILLKFGFYGVYRFNNIMKEDSLIYLLFFSISLLGGILSGLICFCQTDLKSLIAYSSVSHMSIIICSMFNFFNFGVFGSFMMSISHGFCSSCLFSLVNFNYERLNSRMVILNKGLLSMFPSLSFWWFMFCSFNMSCPPSLNLISEIFMFSSMYIFSKSSLIFIWVMPFISAVYSLYLFSFCQHGKFFLNLNFKLNFFLREYLICLLHSLPLALFILKMEMFI